MKAISESRNKSNKATLARVKKQMAQPRIAKSAREGEGEKPSRARLAAVASMSRLAKGISTVFSTATTKLSS